MIKLNTGVIMKERRLWIALFVSCVLVVSLVAACAPKVAPAASEPAATASNSEQAAPAPTVAPAAQVENPTFSMGIPTPDFSPDQIKNPVAKMNPPESLAGSGVFPDNFYTNSILHTGSRGCMSCHADLYSLVKNLSPQMHVASPPTYGKPDDVKYCLTCHDTAGALTGPKFADIIHAYHTNNKTFNDTYQGTCWSCHAVDVNGEMALWDTVKYDATNVGFPGANDDAVILWQQMRGYTSGHMTGFAVDNTLDLQVVTK
jgi:hypothetical protein